MNASLMSQYCFVFGIGGLLFLWGGISQILAFLIQKKLDKEFKNSVPLIQYLAPHFSNRILRGHQYLLWIGGDHVKAKSEKIRNMDFRKKVGDRWYFIACFYHRCTYLLCLFLIPVGLYVGFSVVKNDYQLFPTHGLLFFFLDIYLISAFGATITWVALGRKIEGLPRRAVTVNFFVSAAYLIYRVYL